MPTIALANQFLLRDAENWILPSRPSKELWIENVAGQSKAELDETAFGETETATESRLVHRFETETRPRLQ